MKCSGLQLLAALVMGLTWIPRPIPAEVILTSRMNPEQIRAIWNSAREAYDQAHWPEAEEAYRQILANGYFSHELFYNLGNACFKQGRLGQAILFYRRALYLGPRDPDTLANYQFALQSARVSPPPMTFLNRIFHRGSLTEWTSLETAGVWAAAGIGCLWIVWPRHRPLLVRLLVLMLFPLCLALAAIFHWNGLRRVPEVVVVQSAQDVYYAPLEGATVHFSAPEGTILRRVESSGPWSKVTSGKEEGWIKSTAFQDVYPWTGSTVR